MNKDKLKVLNVVNSANVIIKKIKDKMKASSSENYDEHVVKQQEKAKKAYEGAACSTC